jgi:hypothetical protein
MYLMHEVLTFSNFLQTREFNERKIRRRSASYALRPLQCYADVIKNERLVPGGETQNIFQDMPCFIVVW